MIPKSGGKLRRLGIPTVRDRVAQAALKLVLEPIFEADFKPCSLRVPPEAPSAGRHRRDPLLHRSRSNYEWVLEGDITACFDEIDHSAPHGPGARPDRRQARPGPGEGVPQGRHPLRGWRRAGHHHRHPPGRDPLTAAGEHRAVSPRRALRRRPGRRWATPPLAQRRRRKGLATYSLVRYADDFVVLVSGTRAHAEALREETAAVLAPMGLRLSETKTKIAHIDEGFDFLGFRIQRHTKRGSGKPTVYTYPTKAALAAVKAKVRAMTRGSDQPAARRSCCTGSTRCCEAGPTTSGTASSKATFDYLDASPGGGSICWLRHKHPEANWKQLRRRYLPGWWPTDGQVSLFDPMTVAVTRYRYRATNIASPWSSTTTGTAA